MLENVQAAVVSAFKVNLGFECILYHFLKRVFRYYYVSNNHFLFDKAFTISNQTDIIGLFDKIVSLDLGETYYLRRPTSGWVLADWSDLTTTYKAVKIDHRTDTS